jgi:phage terminase large subunit-like protein
MRTYIEEYYQLILKGEIVVGQKIKQQFQKLVHDLYNPFQVQKLQPDGTYKTSTYIYDANKANKPITFIETFCLQSKAPFCGQPLVLLTFQKAIIQAVYGFVDKDTGLRRYKECFLEIARKNGKSTLISGLSAYHLICEKGISILNCANTMKQANIVFEETKNFILQSPILSKRCKKRKSDLYVPNTFSMMLPLANNAQNLDGFNGDVVLMDEIAGFTSTKMYDILKQSQGSKLEPLLFMFSTNGFVRDNFFDSKLDYANDVLNDIIQDHTFISFLYELDALKHEDAEKEIECFRNWAKTNPACPAFRSFEELEQEVKKAKVDKSYRPTLYAKYFNIAESDAQGWLTIAEATNTTTFDLEEFRDCYCIGGVDLSSVNDLTSATLLFMKPDSDLIYVLNKAWIPKDKVQQKEIDDKVPYSKWIDAGWLDTSGDAKIDYNDVTNWFIELNNKYNFYIRWIGYDNWNSQYWIKQMKDNNFTMEEVRQGFQTFTNPLKELTAKFQTKKVIYNNSPLLKWAILNTKIEIDKNDNWRPVKGKNNKRRIDPLMSLLDAYVVLTRNYEDFTSYL